MTPPATPAVVHYRGASFDLVNPHASLKLDAIETPSREIESQEYLPLQLYEDPLSLEEVSNQSIDITRSNDVRWRLNELFTEI